MIYYDMISFNDIFQAESMEITLAGSWTLLSMVDPVCLLWRLEPPSFFSLLASKMGTSMEKLGLNLGDLL